MFDFWRSLRRRSAQPCPCERTNNRRRNDRRNYANPNQSQRRARSDQFDTNVSTLHQLVAQLSTSCHIINSAWYHLLPCMKLMHEILWLVLGWVTTKGDHPLLWCDGSTIEIWSVNKYITITILTVLELVAMVLGAMVSTLYQLVAIATVLDDTESTHINLMPCYQLNATVLNGNQIVDVVSTWGPYILECLTCPFKMSLLLCIPCRKVRFHVCHRCTWNTYHFQSRFKVYLPFIYARWSMRLMEAWVRCYATAIASFPIKLFK